VSAFASVRATISGADHPFRTAGFCSARVGRRGFAFPCFALPRRHCSTTSTALGASLNVWVTSFSAVFFLSFTLLLSFWIGSAFRFALIGLGFGAILALLGLAMTRWESRSEGLFYTPNRWLAVVVTLAIAARFIYGWWRATHSGSSALGDQHWLITASGTQLSLAVAAGLIGYYLLYSIGVRLRLTRHEQRREA